MAADPANRGAAVGECFVVALIVLAPLVSACAVIDADCHRIPTVLVRSAGLLCCIALGVGAWVADDWPRFGRAVLAAVAFAGVFGVKWVVGGTGLGDVRLAAVLALILGWLGWAEVFWLLVIPYVIALPVALARLVRGRREAMAFGPPLVVGFYLVLGVSLW